MKQEDLYKLAETSIEELSQYCVDVIDGRIISCQKHKWACQRFLRDLERQGKKDFPYIFDEEKANRFLRWMTYFKHTKGPLEGQYKIPVLIEKFIFGNIYGWVHKDTGNRRFRKAYWQVARKNAKSQDLAIVGLYEVSAFGEPYSEVYIAATKKDQTRYVWGEARLISEKCKYLDGKIMAKYHQDLNTKVIMHPKSNSFFARMSKDDKKKGDGANPQCGLLDEYHLHDTSEYYDVLSSGMKTRKQPLLMTITTAGFELKNPCYREEYPYVSDILDPNSQIENDRYFAMINELDKNDDGNLTDDIKDESCWLKPNPIVATTPEGLDSIRDELTIALDKPEKMRDFLTKTMNVWVNDSKLKYMNREKFKKCGTNNFPDTKGMEVFVGVDLTSKIDLASVGFEFNFGDKVGILGHSFMPEATLFAKMKTDKVPYDMWIKQGWLTMTPGEVIDDRVITEYIMEQIERYKWEYKYLGFDLYNATQFANVMNTDYGFETIEIRQGIPSLHEPTKSFREMTYSGKVIHNNNPVISWAFGNAITEANKQGNIMLSKGASSERIDPAASIINSHYLYTKLAKQEDKIPYNEDRGIIVI